MKTFTKQELEFIESNLKQMKLNQELVVLGDLTQDNINELFILLNLLASEYAGVNGREFKALTPYALENVSKADLDELVDVTIQLSEKLYDVAKSRPADS